MHKTYFYFVSLVSRFHKISLDSSLLNKTILKVAKVRNKILIRSVLLISNKVKLRWKLYDFSFGPDFMLPL